MEKEFSLSGINFRLNKIDAFKQFHIVRRLGPILTDLLPAMKEFSNLDGKSEDEKLESVSRLAQPFMNGIAKLSDADAELVFQGLLASVEFQGPVGMWARLFSNQTLMAQNLELPILFQIAGRALMFNLYGFFAALPAK
jgi:hypothetical protein